MKKRKPLIVLMICIMVFHLFAAGKKHVVPMNYSSIQEALDASTENDTVFVLNGTYRERVVLPERIFLQGQNTDKTIIKGNQKDPVIKVSNYSIVSNFTISHGGIGILSENTNAVIQNNIIKENLKTAIHCLISLPRIYNNLVTDNGWSGIFCELVSYSSQSGIEQNVVSHNGYCGIMLSRKSGVLVQNNVIFGNKQFGVFVSQDSRKSRIIYNDFFQNRKDYNDLAVIDETNISINPMYPNLRTVLFEHLSTLKTPINSLGKNGLPIGIISQNRIQLELKDTDEDGVDDENDKCQDIAEDFDGFEDDDGCPEYDNDKDGIPDRKDECPNYLEDFDGYKDQDGCPEYDNDRDGIPDSIDQCPNQSETFNGFKDDDGCPDEKMK